MAGRTLPGLGLTAFYNIGEDGWGDQLSTDIRLLSASVQLQALSLVAIEPESPADGDIYILTATSNAGKLILRDNGEWAYITPRQGWIAFIADTQIFRKYVGTTWSPLIPGETPTPDASDIQYAGPSAGPDNVQDALDLLFSAPGGGIGEAPTDGGYYARRNSAWEAFALPDYTLNVISSSSASYTPAVSNGTKQFVRLSNASPTCVVPNDSAQDFPIGTVIDVQQVSAGEVVFDPAGGVTLESRGGADQTAGQYAIAALIKVAANTWTLTGDVE